MIARLRTFGAFWYDFVIGDDRLVALGVVGALAATYALTQWTSLPAWWLLPVAVALLLPISLVRAVRAQRRLTR